MSTWTRIGDDLDAMFGKHTWRFEHNSVGYAISVDQSEQDYISVEHGGKTERWPVILKEHNGEHFKLSGIADWTPELMDEPCWFVLIMDGEPEITYWGDKVIYRIDRALG